MEQFKLTAESHVEEPKRKRGRPPKANKDEIMDSSFPASLINHPKGKRGRPAEPKNDEQQKEGTNNNIGETKKKHVVVVIEDSSHSASLSNQSDSWECPPSHRKHLIPDSKMNLSRRASLRSSKKLTEHHQTGSPRENSSAVAVFQHLVDPVDTTNISAYQENVGNSVSAVRFTVDDEVNLVGKSLAVDTLDKYQVKPELINILRKIVSVHGDIVQSCTISTIKYRSMYLEVICDMIIELQGKRFTETEDDRLQDMMVLLEDMKNKKVDVEWLQQKLVEILEARQIFKHSMMLKEKRECHIKFIKHVEQELKEKEEEIEAIKAKLQSLHDEKTVCKEKLDKAREECSSITTILEVANSKMKRFQNLSLVNVLVRAGWEDNVWI